MEFGSLSVDELLRAGDLALVQDGNHGGNYPKVEEFQASGIPLITGACIEDGRINFNKAQFLSEERCSKLRVGFAKEGDVLITHKGTMGKTAIVPKLDTEFVILNPQLTLYRVADNCRILRHYLKYYFDSPVFQNEIYRVSGTSTINTLSIKEQKRLEIPVPSKLTQQAIVDLVSPLDDKIELNRQINSTLESMAQALFKSWFVDFDPVIDNALAAGNDIPEPLQAKAEKRKALGDQRKPLPDGLQQQFPDRFVFTEEMGWVPEGWTPSTLGGVADIVMGQSPKGDSYNVDEVGLPLVNGPVEFGEYFTKKTKWTTAPTKVSKADDLVVCVRGSTTGRYVKSDGEYCLGRGVCAIRAIEYQPFIDYLYKYSVTELLTLTTGSTFPNWSGPTLKGFPIRKPPERLLKKFTQSASAWSEKQGNNIIENKALSMLRDTLLPKLLSGELRIPEAEKQVAEAV